MENMHEDQFNGVFKYLKKNSIEEIKKERNKTTVNNEKVNNDDRNVIDEDQNEAFGDQWVNEFITI